MNILVLNGSPRGEASNTLRLTRAFLEGIGQRRDAETEIIHADRTALQPCRGCFACWNRTPGKCMIDDEMEEIILKLRRADVIIWSFPLYYFSLPAQMKTLMDRQLPMFLPFMDEDAASGGHPCRYDMTGKRYVVISTCGLHTAEGNYDAVTAQFDRIYGPEGYTALFCGQGELFRVPQLKRRTDEYLEAMKEAGAEFAGGRIGKTVRKRLETPLFPREIFERMANESWGIGGEGEVPDAAEPGLVFTRQMAALYDKSSWKGKDVVLEFFYTDTGERCQIVLEKEGYRVLTEAFRAHTVRIETPLEVWKRIGSGEISGQQALMDRLYKVTGDFGVMLKWDEYFCAGGGGPSQPESAEEEKRKKKTNMTLMLLPWIAVWVLLPMDPFRGGIGGLLACAALPFGFLKYKPVVFEPAGIFFVSVISLLSALGYPPAALVSSSYLIFGLLWTVTLFLRVPLSAWYSMNRYGEEKALENPLFIRTNRILTGCWGILYLIMPVWTFFLMRSPQPALTGLINSLFPAAMGLFTVWFQKWYPARYAAGRVK